MTAAPSAPGGWQWRPIAEAPQQLRDAVFHMRGEPGDYRTRLCHLYDYERREQSVWVVMLDSDVAKSGAVMFLDKPLPEPDWRDPPATAASKIMAGLDDALAHARGDTTAARVVNPGTRALDEPTRSAADAALDVAVRALRDAARMNDIAAGFIGGRGADKLAGHFARVGNGLHDALAKIEAIAPGAGR